VSAQVSFIPLHAGDATVGGFSGVGPTIRVGVAPGGGALTLEASYTATAGDDARGKPSVSLASLLIGAWLPNRDRVRAGWVGVGISRLSIETTQSTGCLPPCIPEGGSNFRDATLTAITGGVGIALPVSGAFSLRGDARIHLPLNGDDEHGDSRKRRVELALGVMWRR
jgi:hypothetical protein